MKKVICTNTMDKGYRIATESGKIIYVQKYWNNGRKRVTFYAESQNKDSKLDQTILKMAIKDILKCSSGKFKELYESVSVDEKQLMRETLNEYIDELMKLKNKL